VCITLYKSYISYFYSWKLKLLNKLDHIYNINWQLINHHYDYPGSCSSLGLHVADNMIMIMKVQILKYMARSAQKLSPSSSRFHGVCPSQPRNREPLGCCRSSTRQGTGWSAIWRLGRKMSRQPCAALALRFHAIPLVLCGVEQLTFPEKQEQQRNTLPPWTAVLCA